MQEAMLKSYTTITAWRMSIQDYLEDKSRDERGEGIISLAIAILIVAALGVVAYGAFKGLFDSTKAKAETKVGEIGT